MLLTKICYKPRCAPAHDFMVVELKLLAPLKYSESIFKLFLVNLYNKFTLFLIGMGIASGWGRPMW